MAGFSLLTHIAEQETIPMAKLLFLAANPLDTDSLRLDEEMRAIDISLRQADLREQFDVRSHWAVRIGDLQELLLRYQPDIVHFSGHGSNAGEIVLQDAQGQGMVVPPAALADLFGLLSDTIRCVVLNACYSADQAEAIAGEIDCVIGMTDAITDTASIEFSTAFYRALGYGRSVQSAFDLGCNQIDLASLDEAHKPLLLGAADPESVYLATTEKTNDQSSPAGSGDTFNVQFGDNASEVTFGKNIIQIGTLKIPRWLAFAVLAGVAIIVIVLIFNLSATRGVQRVVTAPTATPTATPTITPTPTPEPMDGRFNIAVARFGEFDESGDVQPSKDGSRLSQWVTAKLIDEFEANKELFGSGNVIKLRLIADDFNDDYVQSGTLSGATDDKRKAGAEALAAQVGADMVVYGNLTPLATDGEAEKQLNLEFYLDPAFGGEETQQVVGHYSLGNALPVSASLDGLGSFATAGPLETRAQALAGLTIGLIYDLVGDHTKALAILEELETDQPNWEDDQGKELLYYLMSRQQLFLDEFDAAEASAQRALIARPGYSRAHVVLGSVFAKRAINEMLETQTPEREYTAKALAEYEAATISAENEGNDLVAQAARMSLASAYLLEGQAASLAADSEAAVAALDRALSALDSVYSPLEEKGQYRYLAQAHQFAGNAHFLKAAVSGNDGDLAGRKENLLAAQNAYTLCIEQGLNAREDRTLQEQVIDEFCQPMLDTTLDELEKVEATS